MNDMEWLRVAIKRGFLWTPCTKCGQRLVIARSGKHCINCGYQP